MCAVKKGDPYIVGTRETKKKNRDDVNFFIFFTNLHLGKFYCRLILSLKKFIMKMHNTSQKFPLNNITQKVNAH